MADTESLKLLFEGVVAFGVLASGAATLIKLGAIGNQIKTHGESITDLKETAKRQADTLAMVAVQKSELAAVREIVAALTKRTDETFGRVFNRLDGVVDPKYRRNTD